MSGHGTPGPPLGGPVTKESPPIDSSSLFSAPEGQPRCPAAASPPPATNPFQAPDFGEADTFPPDDVQPPTSNTRGPRAKAA